MFEHSWKTKNNWQVAFTRLLSRSRWILAIAGLAILCTLLVLSLLGDVRRTTQADHAIAHTLEVIIETQRVWSAVQNTEVYSKDYFLTLQNGDAVAYHQSVEQLSALLVGLKHMNSGNEDQERLLVDLSDAIKKRIDITDRAVELASKGQVQLASGLQKEGNVDSLGVIRQKIGEVIAEEHHILSLKRERSELSESRHNITILAAAVVGALTAAVSGAAWLAKNRRAEYLYQMQETQTRLNLAQEAGDVGLWECNLDNNAFFWSPVQYGLHEIPLTVAPGLDTLLDKIYPEDRELIKRNFNYSQREGKPIDVVYRLPLSNGEMSWLHAKGHIIRNRDQEIIKLIGVTVDVSSQHERTIILEKMNAELETRVNQEVSARERAAADLAQSRKMDALGQLTGGVAHDFNNLLQAVASSASMIEKRAEDPFEVRRMIDVVKKAAERGSSLTKRMLAFARQQDLRPDTIAIKSLVEDMASMLERTLGPRVHIDATSFPDDVWPTRVDSNQLELALLNLAVNARDAMPSGGELKISARNEVVWQTSDIEELKQGEYLVVEVADTGSGMDDITLSRAVEPFFTTKGIGKGTGLGLPMVHGLAAQSGGALKLFSQPGKGTRAEIWLPRAEDSAELVHANALAIAVQAQAEEEPFVETLNILLVDDDALVLDVATDTLEDMGHQVFVAASGEAAYAMLETDFDVDLMITDQSMPGMTGMDLAILAREIKPRMAIILATGYSEFPLRDDVLDHAPLRKPYTQNDLRLAIKISLKNAELRNQPQTEKVGEQA